MEALSKGQPWLGIPKALLEFLPMERLPGLAVPRLGLAHPWHLWAVPTAGPGAAPVGLEAPWECRAWAGGEQKSSRGRECVLPAPWGSKKGSELSLHSSLSLKHSIKTFIRSPRKKQKVSGCPVSTACCGRRVSCSWLCPNPAKPSPGSSTRHPQEERGNSQTSPGSLCAQKP